MLCFALLACYAWEALGLALVGGGCEMGRFGHVFAKPLHVEGGLSTVHFLCLVHRVPDITKEVPDCGWLELSSDEKNI